MAFSLVTNAEGVANTAAADTTGATLIVCYVAYGSSQNFSDNKSNDWTALTERGNGTDGYGRLYYCINPIVGAGHTFSTDYEYGAVFMAAFSGDILAADQENGNSASSGTSVQPGSVTPSSSNQVLLCGLSLGGNGTSPGIDSGFTETDDMNASAGVNYGGGLAYLVQTSAAAVNPTWSWTNSVANVSAIGTFSIKEQVGFIYVSS